MLQRKINKKTKIKESDLFIILLPTAFDDAVGSFCFYNPLLLIALL